MPIKQLAKVPNKEPQEPKSDKSQPVPQASAKVEVTHGNAPLLTVKFLELILQELREIKGKMNG